MLKISVFIPTYCRTQDLRRCLDALKQQTRLPDEVVITVRDTDEETLQFLADYDALPLHLVIADIQKPGLLEAHNRGYQTVSGDIVAITDDDAAPRSDWLARIEEHYLANPQIGGVGGRDILYKNGCQTQESQKMTVGQIAWFGNVIGNHHLGYGKVREVDILKGVNSSYRQQVIANFQYEACLQSSGTNTHWELAMGLHAKSQGWKLIYDPAVLVDHYQGARLGMAERLKVTQRETYNSQALRNSISNQTYILLSHLSQLRRYAFLAWSILIGSKGRRGLVQCFRFLPSEGKISIQKIC